MGKFEKVCQNCYWYKCGKNYSDKIRCINLERDNWKGIEQENTCKDFIIPEDYKPTEVWVKVVNAVDKEIKKDNTVGMLEVKYKNEY